MDGRIYAIDPHGNDVLVGGTLPSIQEAPDTRPLQGQSFLLKFNVATGHIDFTFDPEAFSPGSYALDVSARDAAGKIDPASPWVFTAADP
jgi:hypothetical protein